MAGPALVWLVVSVAWVRAAGWTSTYTGVGTLISWSLSVLAGYLVAPPRSYWVGTPVGVTVLGAGRLEHG